jgi:hypothetical protein
MVRFITKLNLVLLLEHPLPNFLLLLRQVSLAMKYADNVCMCMDIFPTI